MSFVKAHSFVPSRQDHHHGHRAQIEQACSLFSPTHHPLIRASSSDEGLRDTALLVASSSIGYLDDRDRVEGIDKQSDQQRIKALVRLISTDHSLHRLSVGRIDDPIN